MALQTEIDRKLTGRMALASRAFLWAAAAGIIGVLAAFGYTQRWFTPTVELYFYAPTASGLSRGMALKLVGFNVGSLDQLSMVGELRIKGKVVMDRRYRDSVGKDSRIRLARDGVLGTYVLELIPGQGDQGPVVNGTILDYERDLDYSAVVAGLVERIGPVLDDIRVVTARLGDPEGDMQKSIRNLNDAAVALTGMAHGLRQLGADGSSLVRGMSGRIDPLFEEARGRLTQAEAVLGDAQRSLSRTNSMLQRMDEALPGMIDDTRRSLQSVRAATENLDRAMAVDVPRIVRRSEATLDDADDILGGVRRSWPVRDLLPVPAEKLIELDSADGAAHVLPAQPGR